MQIKSGGFIVYFYYIYNYQTVFGGFLKIYFRNGIKNHVTYTEYPNNVYVAFR